MTDVQLPDDERVSDFDELAVTLVIEDGHRMKLRGADRREAIRRMHTLGFSAQSAGDALMLSKETFRQAAVRLGLVFPASKPPQHWTVPYVCPSESSAQRAARKQREKHRR